MRGGRVPPGGRHRPAGTAGHGEAGQLVPPGWLRRHHLQPPEGHGRGTPGLSCLRPQQRRRKYFELFLFLKPPPAFCAFFLRIRATLEGRKGGFTNLELTKTLPVTATARTNIPCRFFSFQFRYPGRGVPPTTPPGWGGGVRQSGYPTRGGTFVYFRRKVAKNFWTPNLTPPPRWWLLGPDPLPPGLIPLLIPDLADGFSLDRIILGFFSFGHIFRRLGQQMHCKKSARRTQKFPVSKTVWTPARWKEIVLRTFAKDKTDGITMHLCSPACD